jgi:hypothetical protein
MSPEAKTGRYGTHDVVVENAFSGIVSGGAGSDH